MRQLFFHDVFDPLEPVVHRSPVPPSLQNHSEAHQEIGRIPRPVPARCEAEQTPASLQRRREPQPASTACEDPVQPTASGPPPLSSNGSFIAIVAERLVPRLHVT